MSRSSLFPTLAGLGLRTPVQTSKQILPAHRSRAVPSRGKPWPRIRLAGTRCRLEQSCLAAMAVRMGWRALETARATLPTPHVLYLEAA